MADLDEIFNDQASYIRDPLYEQAMQQMAAGDESEALATVERLAELYPEEQFIQELLLRLQLRTTFGTSDYIRVEHSQPTPVLRTVVLLLLGITSCLVLVAGLAAAKNRWYDPMVEAEEMDTYIQSLWADVDRRVDAGDFAGAREILAVLSSQTPNDPKIKNTLGVIDQRKAWADTYADGVYYKERGDVQTALDLLYQIPPESPDHGRAQRLINEMLDQLALDSAWQDVQSLLQAEDWQGAISTLNWIRAQSPEFRRAEVEDSLYRIHDMLARELIDEANGDVELLRRADGHLSEALTLRPTAADLIEEKRLAVGFVAGAEARSRGDWVAVVVRLEPVYDTRPDYQGGRLERVLDEAYPLAAEQLLSEANGSVRLISQAIGYLDKALIKQPDDEELLEARDLAVEYLAGLEAFARESWNLAITHWGPIYLVQPGYQNGALEENLRLACANSETPDETLCPP